MTDIVRISKASSVLAGPNFDEVRTFLAEIDRPLGNTSLVALYFPSKILA